MPVAVLKTLFDKRQRAMTRARFRAWWEGEAFDSEAAAAEIEAKLAEAEIANGDADDALFDPEEPELSPRLAALTAIWGEHRVRPGEASAEGLEPARIGIAPEGTLAVFGPGLAAPVEAIAGAHSGKIEVFEWREETLERLQWRIVKAGLEERVSAARIDLEAHVWPQNHYDGLFSVDDFAYCGYPPHLAQQIMKCLKPGACAVVETYTGLPCEPLPTAFASSFAEPQIRAHGDLLQFFTDAGLTLEADEDLTEEFHASAREGFKRLAEALEKADQLGVRAVQELAWEAEAWRVRLMLLSQRRLERRRFTLRKPAAAAPEPEPAEQAPAAPEAEER